MAQSYRLCYEICVLSDPKMYQSKFGIIILLLWSNANANYQAKLKRKLPTRFTGNYFPLFQKLIFLEMIKIIREKIIQLWKSLTFSLFLNVQLRSCTRLQSNCTIRDHSCVTTNESIILTNFTCIKALDLIKIFKTIIKSNQIFFKFKIISTKSHKKIKIRAEFTAYSNCSLTVLEKIIVNCCKSLFQLFYTVNQRHIQSPVTHLRWSFQPLTILAKTSILDVWQGSEYASVAVVFLHFFFFFFDRKESSQLFFECLDPFAKDKCPHLVDFFL